MLALLEQNPILLLFVVAAIGYPLGRVKVAGFSLGVAAVLFVGLGFGAIQSDLKLPEVIYQFGLVLFVYTIGLSSGPGFFAALRRRGLRDNAFVLAMLVAAGGLVALVGMLLRLTNPLVAGLFTGAFTNTPALAGALETLKATAPSNLSPDALERYLAQPVVAYSVAYPMGVIGVLLAIWASEKLWRIDHRKEAARVPELGGTREGLTHQSILVTAQELRSRPITQIARERGWPVLLGRYQHAGKQALVSPSTVLEPGDVISLIGSSETVGAVGLEIGEPSTEALELDRRSLDFRRMVVSNPGIAGMKLSNLHLPQQFGAIITRVGRGDLDLLPSGETVLELGDRVRIVCPPDRMRAVSGFLGDSYRAIAEIDVMTFGLGIALGLLVGSLPIPLPGGAIFKLGFAGGPLIVGLVLGALGRTGRVLWQLPHGANLTLRQLGLILFLAGVGTRSGYAFASTLASGAGLGLFVAGAILTALVAMSTLWVGYRLLGIPYSLLIGMLSGLQTQPAALGFSSERAENDLPNIGYATVYPMATIAKIVIAQLLLSLPR